MAAFCFKFVLPSGTTAYSTAATSSNAEIVAGTKGAGYIDLGADDAFAMNTNQGTEYKGLGGGFSNDLYVEALVTTTMNDHPTTPVATVAVTIETADDSAFSSNLTTLMTLGTFAAASAKGERLVQQLPPTGKFRRYLRAKFTVAGGPLTAGAFSCFITNVLNANKSGYPERTSIIAG